ncbi:hypothetical protein [Candidatus Protochlamydia phocaeensis]|uniref:hypothetical protein n=1 Tax=Candidatus Protochlamydia phocaeensis TaxID=1414722 RepID=UPI000837FE0C|nr:hypothetical protein [Candidatus Protochlamydia phocaeensis]
MKGFYFLFLLAVLVGGFTLFQRFQNVYLTPNNLREGKTSLSLIANQDIYPSPSTIDYALYAHPLGAFGKELANYVKKVQSLNEGIEIARSPSIVLINSFQSQYSETNCIAALRKALDEIASVPRHVHVEALYRTPSGYDYISIESPFFHQLAQQFASLLNLDNRLVNPAYQLPLSLKPSDDDKINALIDQWQNDIQLGASAKWAIILYRRQNGKVKAIKRIYL